jgi:uncharacterized protein (DUF2461 family)
VGEVRPAAERARVVLRVIAPAVLEKPDLRERLLADLELYRPRARSLPLPD